MAVTPEQRRHQQQVAFRQRLQQALDAKDWKQKDLAKALHVAESSVTGWLRHGALPGADILFDLPYALGVSADWLLTGRGDQRPPKEASAPAIEFLQGGRTALNEVEMEFRQVLEAMGLRWKEEGEASRLAAASLAHERADADSARATPARRRQARRGAS